MSNILKNIKDIEKFCNDDHAWYLVRLLEGLSQDDLYNTQKELEKLKLPGKFVFVTGDVTIEDITNSIKM